MSPGDAVQFKRRPGLAFRWSAGQLVQVDGRMCVVRGGNGEEYLLDRRLVKAAKDKPRPPSRALTRAPAPEMVREVTTGTSSGTSTPRRERFRSDAYLAFVRTHACCSCTTPGPSDPHHFGRRGMGQKCDDTLVVPLCRACHDLVHSTGALTVSGAEYASLDDKAATAWLFDKTSRDLLASWVEGRGKRGRS